MRGHFQQEVYPNNRGLLCAFWNFVKSRWQLYCTFRSISLTSGHTATRGEIVAGEGDGEGEQGTWLFWSVGFDISILRGPLSAICWALSVPRMQRSEGWLRCRHITRPSVTHPSPQTILLRKKFVLIMYEGVLQKYLKKKTNILRLECCTPGWWLLWQLAQFVSSIKIVISTVSGPRSVPRLPGRGPQSHIWWIAQTSKQIWIARGRGSHSSHRSHNTPPSCRRHGR